MWLNYAHKVFTNLEPIPSVTYSVKLKVFFFPCCSFRPKSIVKEQKLIFNFFFFIAVWYLREFQISFIQQVFTVFLTVNSPCDITCVFLPIEVKGVGGITDTLNIFQNEFSKYNSVNCFHGLIRRVGGKSVAMQSCLNAVLVRHSRYKCELFKCSHFSGLETNLIQYWPTFQCLSSLCPSNNFSKFKCNFQLGYSYCFSYLITLQTT